MLLFRRSRSNGVFRLCIKSKKRHNCSHKIWRRFTTRAEDTIKSERRNVVDLRSDTVTSPTRAMLNCALHAQTGDDVYGEDPTVFALEEYAADLFGKESALFVPTGTMANLVAIMAHCHGKLGCEVLLGANSHLSLYEGGNISTIASIHTRQIQESSANATISIQDIIDVCHTDEDDHYAATALLCLENSQNALGGVALPKQYIDTMGDIAKQHDIPLHVDGARIFNASIAKETPVAELCASADSVSICLSKGLGAPLGSVLVGSKTLIKLAKRARKHVGGGMRQSGVVASMGMYAMLHNVQRLQQDHERAQRFALELQKLDNGFHVLRDGQVDTNMVYFSIPPHALVSSQEELCYKLESEYDIKMYSEYRRGGTQMIRVVTHMDVDDEGIDRTLDGISKLCLGRGG